MIAGPKGESHVEAFFTDCNTEISAFESLLTAHASKRLLVLHGIGGVGKSTLLMMFRRICRQSNIRQAAASAESASTAVDVLEIFASDLQSPELQFREFRTALDEYRRVQARVQTETSKLGLAAGVARGAASVVPGIGPIASSASAPLIEWLRNFLAQPQIDMLLKPMVLLTAAFVADIAAFCTDRRLVLMIDTYERLFSIDPWLRDFAQELPKTAILVIAGREFPIEQWSRTWPGWVAIANVVEVKPMSDEDMRLLLKRYFDVIGAPSPPENQITQIVQFARGLPLVVTAVAGLWQQYGLTDFRKAKPQVIADLVDRLMESVPPEIRRLLEAAAVLRWFNKELLELLIGGAISDEKYDAVRRFEFVRVRAEGPSLHDVVREMTDEYLEIQDPARHRGLHILARDHFRVLAASSNASDDRQKASLECLFHTFRADYANGIATFREFCDRVSAIWDLHLLGAYVAEANSWPIDSNADALWIKYYAARLAQARGDWAEAEEIYEDIASTAQADHRLQAYALSELGNILTRWERIGEPLGIERAKSVLDRSLSLAPLDPQLADALFRIARLAEYQGQWDKAVDSITQARHIFTDNRDILGEVRACNALQAAYVLQGDWRGMRDAEDAAVRLIAQLPHNELIRARTQGYWAWGWLDAGRYAQTERNLRDAIPIVRTADANALPPYFRHLGLACGLQGRYDEGTKLINESIKETVNRGPDYRESWSTSLKSLAVLSTYAQDYQRAEECLSESLATKLDIKDDVGIPEVLLWHGELYRRMGRLEEAKEFYTRSLGWVRMGRKYCEAAALVGLCRVHYETHSLSARSIELTQAEAIASRFEYNDQLATIYLLIGSLALDEAEPAAISSFERAMVYALRFNRFSLDQTADEIVRTCSSHQEMGRQVLRKLAVFWAESSNDIVPQSLNAVSLVSEKDKLVDAEQNARAREPGTGAVRVMVFDRLNAAAG